MNAAMLAIINNDNQSFIADELTLMGSETRTADGVTEVSSTDVIFDTGGGYTEGYLIVDATTVAATTDELYEFKLQGSPDSDFGTAANIFDLPCQINIGAGETLIAATAAQDMGADRYVAPFSNRLGKYQFRYLRLYLEVTGSAPSVAFKAYLTR